MAWTYLILAGIFEIIGALGLANSNGFKHWKASVVTVFGFAISIYLLTLSINEIPIGMAYAVWTGVGASGTAIAGIIYYKESANIMRLLSLILIITGIITLKLIT